MDQPETQVHQLREHRAESQPAKVADPSEVKVSYWKEVSQQFTYRQREERVDAHHFQFREVRW